MKTTVKKSNETKKNFSIFKNCALLKSQTSKVKGGDGLGAEDAIDV